MIVDWMDWPGEIGGSRPCDVVEIVDKLAGKAGLAKAVKWRRIGTVGYVGVLGRVSGRLSLLACACEYNDGACACPCSVACPSPKRVTIRGCEPSCPVLSSLRS